MEIDAEFVRDVLEAFFKRAERIRAAGGIALVDVMNGTTVPTGYVLDWQSDYYLPPGFSETVH